MRASFAIATDFATSAMPAAAPKRSVLGTIGSAPRKRISPPQSSGRSPMPASTSASAACTSNPDASRAGAATAARIVSVSDDGMRVAFVGGLGSLSPRCF
jgi:hypothetical protein